MSETIGFIGLGTLGQPMARNLLQSGYHLKIYNRTASKAEPFAALGAELSSSPANVLTTGGIVVTIISDDAALESIVMSPDFLERLGPDGIHLSMSTVSPELARRLADLHAQHGSHYVEAPVFGGREAVAARELWICLAGLPAGKERVRPLLQVLGQGIFDFGETPGAALLVKLCGNFLIVAAGRAMAEALTLAKKSGSDPAQVITMLTQTLFTTPGSPHFAPIYQSYGPRIAADPEHYTAHWIALKDVGLFNAAAGQVEAHVPLAARLHELLQR